MRILGTVLVILCVTTRSSALDDPSINTIDDLVREHISPYTVAVRSLGMGKTGVAAPDNGNAVFVNPAILASLDSTCINAGFRVKAGLVNDEKGEEGAQEFKAQLRPHVKFTHASILVPISFGDFPISMGAGVGYSTKYDFGETYYRYRLSAGTGGVEELLTQTHGGINFISPAISFGINNMIFIGATFNVSLLNSVSYKQSGSNATTEETFDGEMHFATNLGLLLKPIESVMVGLGYTPGYEWEFRNGSIPPHLSFGATYTITPLIEVSAEAQTRFYENLTINAEQRAMKNGFAVMAGTELSFQPVTARAGLFVETVPRPDIVTVADDSFTDDLNLLLGLTTGATIPLSFGGVDMALVYSRFVRDHTVTDFDEPGTPTVSYTYSENRLRFDVGVTVNIPGVAREPASFESTVSDTVLPPPVDEPGRRKPIY